MGVADQPGRMIRNERGRVIWVHHFRHGTHGDGTHRGRDWTRHRKISHPVHQRVASDDSVLSEGMTAMTFASESSYVPYPNSDTFHARYQVIPWSASGRKRLTVRLSLFMLCLLAGYGPKGLQRWPELEPMTLTSSLDDGGETETEDTIVARERSARKTAKSTSSKSRGKAREEDPGASSGSHENDPRETGSTSQRNKQSMSETVTDSAGNTHWTRSGVQAMEFDEDTGMHQYTDPEGKRRHIERDVSVYDENTSEWGYFYGHEWISIADLSRNDQRRKARSEAGTSSRDSRSKASSSHKRHKAR